METRGGSGLCNGATDQPAVPSSEKPHFRAMDMHIFHNAQYFHYTRGNSNISFKSFLLTLYFLHDAYSGIMGII